MRELSPGTQKQFALQKEHKRRLEKLRERNFGGAKRDEDEEERE